MPTISDKNLIPIMTADTAPAPYVVSVNSNNTNTRPYYVFNGVTSGNNVGWLTVSGTSTGWLKIDMGIPRVIGKYSLFCGNETNFITYMPKTWTIQGSNTGLFTGEQVILHTRTNEAAWTANTKREYIFDNLNSYRYYRIMITVNSGNVNYLGITAMELFEVIPYNKILLSSEGKYYSIANRKYKNVIPVMTSNTSASPIVPIFSTEWTNGIQVGAGSAFNAFDGDINKVSSWSNATNAFIGIDWGTVKLIEGYRITCHPTLSNTPPTGWIFEASQDNTTWITLDTQKGINWVNGEVKEFIFPSSYYYRYYRLRATINGTFAVAELVMLQFSAPSLVAYDEANENTLVKFSESSISDFNSKLNEIKDIKITKTSVSSGKTFEHTIDMSKRRVDKITLG